MNNSVILENITGNDLKELIKGAVREELAAIQPSKNDSYLTRQELSEKLRISLVSLDKAVRNGKLKAYRINGRVLFKESEINLSEIPVRKHK